MTDDLRTAKLLAQAERVSRQTYPTKVAADPRLPVALDFLEASATDSAVRTASFEAGRIAAFHDFPPLGDAGFFKRLPLFPDLDPQIKKAKTKDLFPGTGLLEKILPDSPVGRQVMPTKVAEVVNAARAIVRRLYPRYVLTGYESHSLRLVETFPEGLHVDSYNGHTDNDVQLRLFVNLDDVPRIWQTTYRADELAVRFGHLVPGAATMHPNALNAELNVCVPWPTLPRHQVFFAPGAAWICDSQLVSHEIVYGRRAWAFTFGVKANSLTDPNAAFQARVRYALGRMEPA